MIQFYRETYLPYFEFDDLKNIQFSHYYTDNGFEDSYYDIDLSLLPIETDREYIFSCYILTLGALGPQYSEEYNVRYSLEEDFCLLAGDLNNLYYDKYGNPYPNGVKRIYYKFKPNKANSKIKIRLIEKKDLVFGCKSFNGQEPFLNPKGYSRSYYVYGFQLEEAIQDQLLPSDYFSSINAPVEIGISPNTVQSFQYFIYKLYGLEGSFMEQGNFKFFKERDTSLKEKRRLDCGSTPCFETKNDSLNNYFGNDKFQIYKYKGVQYASSDIFIFFKTEILPYLSSIQDLDFPKLYTDFEKLYIIGQKYNADGTKNGALSYKTYEKTYGNAVIEIINLLTKYKSFDNKIFLNSHAYILPISFPGVSHTPIEDEDFDNILFTGYLNKPVDLNIQAGFCRHYLNPENPKPTISGYFYETSDFFDVKNTDLINEFDQILNIFPSQIEQINKRPSVYINDIRKLNFSRLIKNDSSVNFVKILNYTGYVDECYFKELKTGISVELTGNYITSRRLSDVWEIQIKNAIDSTINDVQLGVTNIGVKSWTFQDFGPLKNSITNSKYLKIIHKNIQLGNIIPVDIANVKLTSTVNGQTYVYSVKVL